MFLIYACIQEDFAQYIFIGQCIIYCPASLFEVGLLPKNPPKPGPNGTGFFAQRKAALAAQSARSITVDSFTADYLLTMAIATHKTPADIIGEMVREQIAAAL